MKILISPAKRMRADVDGLPWRDLPVFLEKTEKILGVLQGMSDEELKKLWKCNDSIAKLNQSRVKNMELYNCLTPAILAYEGIQYQYMAPGVFTKREYEYVQDHLRILSGFYGILRPFDGVTPYRLEMQSRLRVGDMKDLYAYWNRTIADHLLENTKCIINLASKEYSTAVSGYIPSDFRFITCFFGERIDGKVIEKGTMCKMARGEMVRYMAENDIQSPEEMRMFARLGFRYDEQLSNDKKFVYTK